MIQRGASEVHDDERTGRLSDVLTDDAIVAVCALLEEDCRCTISDLHREIAVRFLIDCSRTTIFRILTEVLDMWKVAAR